MIDILALRHPIDAPPACRYHHEDSVATIDTVDDLIRALDVAPHRAEDLRSRILPPDILELSAGAAKEVKRSSQQLVAVGSRLTALEDATSQPLSESFELLKTKLDSLSLDLENMSRRLGRYETDIGLFRSRHAREMVREQSGLLAAGFGYRKIHTLTTDDLCELVDSADTHDIDASDLLSFRRADLVLETVDADDPCYLAVEISFTVDTRNTQRAVRNACLLKRFTGKRAQPVVAGVRKDRRVDPEIDAGIVSWFDVQEPGLETD